MCWANDRAMDVRDRKTDEPTRFTDVWFRDAVKDPLVQIERIYGSVGIDLDAPARRGMEQWLSEHGQQSGAAHRYSPEQFGLTPGEIRERFARYIDRFVTPYSEEHA
jgi:hypothetical protein